MFFAPISQSVTKRGLILKGPTLEHVVLFIAGRSCLRGFLLAFFMVAIGGLHAQEASPQFADLAARAAAARDQQNIPLAIELYTQAEQLSRTGERDGFILACCNMAPINSLLPSTRLTTFFSLNRLPCRRWHCAASASSKPAHTKIRFAIWNSRSAWCCKRASQ